MHLAVDLRILLSTPLIGKKLSMKKLLFICSQNKLRSPTAEAVFSEYEGLETDSAGLDRYAEVPLSTDL